MAPNLRPLVPLCFVLGLLLVAAGPGPEKARPDAAADTHARTIAYWSAERVAGAVARDVVRPGGPQAKPENPGKGGKPGGGGGGSGGDVTGASWSEVGLVQETTGKVLFTLGRSDYVCSGNVVVGGGARSIVLTAGHCVEDGATGGFATNWLFVPDFDNSPHDFDCSATQYGCWTASALVTTRAWADAGDLDHDVGFAVVDGGGHSGTASLSATVGAQAIAFGNPRGERVHAFGYPAAKKFDGNDLVYCAGTTVDDPWSSAQGLRCDMTGGSSGGAWYRDFDEATGTGTAYGVNSFKYQSDSKTMYSPYFGSWEQRTYTAATTHTGSTNVVVS